MKTFEWDQAALCNKRGYKICLKNITGQYSFPLHDHRDMCELIYVREGCLKQKINGVKFEQYKGSLLFIRETDNHNNWGRDVSFINIAFPLWWFKRLGAITGENLFLKLLNTEKKIIHSRVPLTRHNDLIKKIESLHTDSASPANTRFHFLDFLTHVLDEYFLPTTEEINPLPPWMNELLTWINKNPGHVPNIAELSRHCDRTREHLARSFRKYLGLSPSSYLNKRKLTRAARLLQSTNKRIIDISLDTGFESAGYFNRLFKNEYNQTPREYRNKYRGSEYA